jgi:hypothetical protein
MKRLSSAYFALIIVAGCTAAENAPASDPKAPATMSAERVAKEYTTFTSMTKKPVFVDPGLAKLCAGPTQRQVDEARKIAGPHANTAVSIYMNDLAAGAFTKPFTTAYPVGSIIVKKKKALNWTDEQGNVVMPSDGVGGMIKRTKGYDSEHGDWEYFYVENATKIESGKISTCVQCHSGAVKTDHVFGDWARSETRSGTH